MSWVYLLSGLVIQICAICTAAHMGGSFVSKKDTEARGALVATVAFIFLSSTFLFSAGVAWVQP